MKDSGRSSDDRRGGRWRKAAEEPAPTEASTADRAAPGADEVTDPEDMEATAASAEALTERLSAEIEGELAELEELRDRHLRLAAEFENYRKRTRREQTELRAQAQADLVQSLLDTLDDLARMSQTSGEATSPEALHQGVDLIHRKLRKTLEDAGLTPIEALGQPFDPTLHEGVTIAEVDDPERDETVAQVLAEGYRFRGRLIRPARVAVARWSGAPAAHGGAGGGGEA